MLGLFLKTSSQSPELPCLCGVPSLGRQPLEARPHRFSCTLTFFPLSTRWVCASAWSPVAIARPVIQVVKLYLSDYHSGSLFVQRQRVMMNVSEMTFEMTEEENPQIRDGRSWGLQRSTVVDKTGHVTDGATGTAPRSVYRTGHETHLWQNQYRISVSLIKKQKEFYLLFYFANVAFKSNNENLTLEQHKVELHRSKL